MLAETSRRAYRSLDLTEGQRKVMTVFHRFPEETFTRAECAKRGNLHPPSVCGRVNELVAAGFLEELKARPCAVTGNSSHPLRIALPKTGESCELPAARAIGSAHDAAPNSTATQPVAHPTITLPDGSLAEIVREGVSGWDGTHYCVTRPARRVA